MYKVHSVSLKLMDTTDLRFANLMEEFGNSQLCWTDRLIEYVLLFNQLEHNLHCHYAVLVCVGYLGGLVTV